MSLNLKEGQAVAELAECLYPFLPGKAHPYADQSLSFPGIAARLGLEKYWPGGSKQPAITQLLRGTLEYDRARFCPLIVNIVQYGLAYRKNKEPVTRPEVEKLNAIIAQIGFKIPELYDPEFLGRLPGAAGKTPTRDDKAIDAARLSPLLERIMELQSMESVKRGFAFEKFLEELFDVYGLAPRGAFRLTGEQIDGSLVLDGDTYLLEARWRNDQAALADLLTFSGKVSGKAQWSRGVIVSYAGFTEDGLSAFRQGRPANIVGVDGLDLYHILSGKLDLREVLRRKVRRAAETNRIFVPARELFQTVM
jgi:hypothetical protein